MKVSHSACIGLATVVSFVIFSEVTSLVVFGTFLRNALLRALGVLPIYVCAAKLAFSVLRMCESCASSFRVR